MFAAEQAVMIAADSDARAGSGQLVTAALLGIVAVVVLITVAVVVLITVAKVHPFLSLILGSAVLGGWSPGSRARLDVPGSSPSAHRRHPAHRRRRWGLPTGARRRRRG
jgi:hypothetical protein